MVEVIEEARTMNITTVNKTNNKEEGEEIVKGALDAAGRMRNLQKRLVGSVMLAPTKEFDNGPT